MNSIYLSVLIFTGGTFVGAFMGFLLTALMAAKRRDDEIEELQFRIRELKEMLHGKKENGKENGNAEKNENKRTEDR